MVVPQGYHGAESFLLPSDVTAQRVVHGFVTTVV